MPMIKRVLLLPAAIVATRIFLVAQLSWSQTIASAHANVDHLTLPMSFEVNRGQAQPGIDFIVRGQGYDAYLSAGRARLHLNYSDPFGLEQVWTSRELEAEIQLLGANEQPELAPEEELSGRSNYLFGPNPSHWITDVTQYGKVGYRNVYPGIDIIYHGNQNQLEHDFVVHPGADAAQICVAFSGTQKSELGARGDLVLPVADAEFRLEKPRAYQMIGGKEKEVAVEFVQRRGCAGFHFARYDVGHELIIDPVLVYATFLGGNTLRSMNPGINGQVVYAVALDGSGNIYVAGKTNSPSFPVTSGAVGASPSGPMSAFVSKINPAGSSLVYSTYVGGFNIFNPVQITIDTSGNVYLAGTADPNSTIPFPGGSKPFQPTTKGNNLAIVKLNSTATAVLYATYLGGSGTETIGGLAVDSSASAYFTGTTTSNDFPTQNPLQGALGSGGMNAFVTKFDPTASALVYSTYLGQNSQSTSMTGAASVGIALDASDNAWVVGNAGANFPTTAGAFQMTGSGAYLAELNSTGSSLLYATYLAGSAPSAAAAIAMDGSGNIFLTGQSGSVDFPVVNPITSCANTPLFVSEFNSVHQLVFSTCLAGASASLADQTLLGGPGQILSLDSSGNVYVAGTSFYGPNLTLVNPIDANPPTAGNFQYSGNSRSFVSEIDPQTHSLLFSSYIASPFSTVFAVGQSSGDQITAIAVDLSGNIYAVGYSDPEIVGTMFTFPTPLFNALQSSWSDADCVGFTIACAAEEGIILKIAPSSGAAAAISPSVLWLPVTAVGSTSAAAPVTIYDLGTVALTVSDVAVSNGPFTIQSNNCGVVPPSGGSCTVQVVATPTSVGTLAGTVTITDSSAGSPHKSQLMVQGDAPTAKLSGTSLSFPNQAVGTTSSQSVTLTNQGVLGTSILNISRIQTSGNFSENNNCGGSVGPGGSCAINVTFTPPAPGTSTGTLTITDNAPDSPQTVALTGVGFNPGIGLSMAPGASSSATVQAGATATYKLSIGNLGLSGTASLTCAGAPTGATCSVPSSVTFSANTATPVNVSVATSGPTHAMLNHDGSPSWLFALAMAGLLMLPKKRAAKRTTRRYWLLLPSLALLCSCGGSSSPRPVGGTPPGTYTLNVTATSGSNNQSLNLTLTVQ